MGTLPLPLCTRAARRAGLLFKKRRPQRERETQWGQLCVSTRHAGERRRTVTARCPATKAQELTRGVLLGVHVWDRERDARRLFSLLLVCFKTPPPQFFLFTVTQVQGEIESEKKMDKTITTIWWGNYTYPGMNTSLLSGQRGHSQTHCPSGEIQPLFATSENPSNVRLLQSHPHPNDYLKWNRNVSSSAPSCVSTSSSIRPHCVTECDL